MCPFVENADVHCATHLTLHDIQFAFAHCAGRYVECPVYRELLTKACQNERTIGSPLLVAS